MPEQTAEQNTSDFSNNSAESITTDRWRKSRETPVVAAVSAVAEASGRDPTDLPPLNDAIDPEALNDLFTARTDSTVDWVTFQFAGYDVVVRGAGDVQVKETARA